jgi:nischarin
VPTHTPCSTKDEYLQQLVNPVGTSNILASTLNFDLSPFTCVKNLDYCGIVPMNIFTDARTRDNCETLTVMYTRAQTIQNILNPESIHDNAVTDEKWSNVVHANFSFNDIWQLDVALKLIPNVETLLLDGNRLRNVSNVRHLHRLSYLSLSNNLIEDLSNWCMELGNIHTLNLAGNRIVRLTGIGKLRSIRSLDLSCNLISSFDEIDEVAGLPILENLGLNGNPLALECDYRIRVMARFDERVKEVLLDNERCSVDEVDKALVLAALRKSKCR